MLCTHNICFRRVIRKLCTWYSLLSRRIYYAAAATYCYSYYYCHCCFSCYHNHYYFYYYYCYCHRYLWLKLFYLCYIHASNEAITTISENCCCCCYLLLVLLLLLLLLQLLPLLLPLLLLLLPILMIKTILLVLYTCKQWGNNNNIWKKSYIMAHMCLDPDSHWYNRIWSLISTTLWANSADDNLMILLLFSQKIDLDILCKVAGLSKSIFRENKNKKKITRISNCRLPNCLPRMLSIKWK